MSVPRDKLLHILLGALISFSVGLWEPWIGLAAGVVIGVLKEVYDYERPERHTADILDFWATAVGATVGTFLTLVAHYTWVAVNAA